MIFNINVNHLHSSTTFNFSHKNIMVAWQSYEQSKMHGLVMEIASSEYANRVKPNRFYLKTIAENYFVQQ